MEKKKMLKVLSLVMVLVMGFAAAGCVTSNTISKQFEKKGYTMGSYGWSEMSSVCPILSGFPSCDATSMGYVVAADVYTFAYKCDASTMDAYVQKLTANGFKSVGGGAYSKLSADKSYQYKVKITPTVLNKETYYLVGFSTLGA